MDSDKEKNPADRARSPVDIESILLPKKEAHAPGVAERVNAGRLLEQEQNATLVPAKQVLAEDSSAASPAQVKKEESGIKQLQTYSGDIQKVVEEKKVSVVSIAAAEAARRSTGGAVLEKTNTKEDFITLGKRTAAIAGGVALVALAAGILWYVVLLFQPVSPNAGAPLAPFILVDATKTIPAASGESRTALMKNLTGARDAVHLSLGLVERLYLPQDAPTLLTLLAPTIPQDLLRTVQPTYLLGIHSFDGNQPFFIFSVDVYQQGYSGMLEWERGMQQDLAPLFTYVPHLRTSQIDNPATSSPQATQTASGIFQTGFTDAIVENHDARVVKNSRGDIVLLWTFLDRSTLVITTNENTLREVIVRLKNAPILPVQ